MIYMLRLEIPALTRPTSVNPQGTAAVPLNDRGPSPRLGLSCTLSKE
jgi:hypothetical protein